MKMMKRALVILFSAALLFSVDLPAKAAEYTYTVRIFTGVQGTIDSENFVTVDQCVKGEAHASGRLDASGEYYVIEGLHYGDRVRLEQSAVKVPLGENNLPVKYNARGFRVSGRDNSDADAAQSFPVREDIDYVVAYNILNDPVEYTVRYVDAEGNTLREPDVYYGNVGEKPVVAYRYIDSYQPSSYNMTGTLKRDEENVFTFVYTLIPPQEVITNTTVIVIPGTEVDLGTTVIEGEGGGGQAPAPAPIPGGGDEPPQEENIPENEIPTNDGQPNEITNIDENDTPTSGGNIVEEMGKTVISILNGNASFVDIPLAVRVSLLLLLAGLIALGVWGVVRYRKGKKS